MASETTVSFATRRVSPGRSSKRALLDNCHKSATDRPEHAEVPGSEDGTLGRSFIAFGYSIDSCGRAASRLKTEE